MPELGLLLPEIGLDIVVFLVASLAFAALLGSGRRAAMQDLARLLRLRHDDRRPAKFNPAATLGMTTGAVLDPFDFTRRYDWLFPFDRGHSQASGDVVHGERAGRRTFLFDWEFHAGRGKDHRRLTCSVVLVETPYRFHELWIRPVEGTWDVEGAPRNGMRLNAPEFHKRFFAQAESPHQGELILSPEVTSFLVDRPGVWLIFSRHVIVAILVPPSMSNTAPMLAETLSTIEGILARLPDPLKAELKRAKDNHREPTKYG